MTTVALRPPRAGTHINPVRATPAPLLDESVGGVPSDRDFIAMRTAYRASGGIACGDDLARLLEDHQRGDFISLAKLIVAGEVFGFDRHHTFWVPMFQFELHDLSVKPASRQVLAELGSAFDGWSLATWFVRANCWLNGQRPVDLLDSNRPSVLEAARVDRFIAVG